jgi:hypothetical protein
LLFRRHSVRAFNIAFDPDAEPVRNLGGSAHRRQIGIRPIGTATKPSTSDILARQIPTWPRGAPRAPKSVFACLFLFRRAFSLGPHFCVCEQFDAFLKRQRFGLAFFRYTGVLFAVRDIRPVTAFQDVDALLFENLDFALGVGLFLLFD